MESIDVLVQYLYVNFMHFAIFGFNKKLLFCFVFWKDLTIINVKIFLTPSVLSALLFT